MNDETKLQIQALLDGELSPTEAARITALIQSDAQAAALQKELVWVRQATRDNEPAATLKDTREFYWSQIKRGIEASERRPVVAIEKPSWTALLSRWLIPVASAAALVILLTSVGKYDGLFLSSAKRMSLLHEIDSPIEETSTFDFYDAKTGVTVVWVAGLGE